MPYWLDHIARHYVHGSYHALHRLGVPSGLVPDAFLLALTLTITLWLVIVSLVGRQASRKGQSFWYGFLFAAIATPPIASFFIAFLRPLKTVRRSPGKRSTTTNKFDRDRERVA